MTDSTISADTDIVDDLRMLEKTWPSPTCGRAAFEIECLRSYIACMGQAHDYARFREMEIANG